MLAFSQDGRGSGQLSSPFRDMSLGSQETAAPRRPPRPLEPLDLSDLPDADCLPCSQRDPAECWAPGALGLGGGASGGVGSQGSLAGSLGGYSQGSFVPGGTCTPDCITPQDAQFDPAAPDPGRLAFRSPAAAEHLRAKRARLGAGRGGASGACAPGGAGAGRRPPGLPPSRPRSPPCYRCAFGDPAVEEDGYARWSAVGGDDGEAGGGAAGAGCPGGSQQGAPILGLRYGSQEGLSARGGDPDAFSLPSLSTPTGTPQDQVGAPGGGTGGAPAPGAGAPPPAPERPQRRGGGAGAERGGERYGFGAGNDRCSSGFGGAFACSAPAPAPAPPLPLPSSSRPPPSPSPPVSASSWAGFASRYRTEYREVGLLGQGSFSRVFRARHRLDGREYAVKRTARAVRPGSADFAHFLVEAQALARLPAHAHVIRYYASWVEPAGPPSDPGRGVHAYLSLELAEGCLASARAAEGAPAGARDVARILAHVAAGLAHLHAHGIAHGDVKPENIYLAPDADADEQARGPAGRETGIDRASAPADRGRGDGRDGQASAPAALCRGDGRDGEETRRPRGAFFAPVEADRAPERSLLDGDRVRDPPPSDDPMLPGGRYTLHASPSMRADPTAGGGRSQGALGYADARAPRGADAGCADARAPRGADAGCADARAPRGADAGCASQDARPPPSSSSSSSSSSTSSSSSPALFGKCLKLGDLGVASRTSSSPAPRGAQPPQAEGDARYLSLEVLRGDRSDLPAADVFALGATALEAASGIELPASGGAYQALREGRLPLLPGLPAPLARLVARMMHPDPAQRPTAAAVARHPAVLRYLHGEQKRGHGKDEDDRAEEKTKAKAPDQPARRAAGGAADHDRGRAAQPGGGGSQGRGEQPPRKGASIRDRFVADAERRTGAAQRGAEPADAENAEERTAQDAPEVPPPARARAPRPRERPPGDAAAAARDVGRELLFGSQPDLAEPPSPLPAASPFASAALSFASPPPPPRRARAPPTHPGGPSGGAAPAPAATPTLPSLFQASSRRDSTPSPIVRGPRAGVEDSPGDSPEDAAGRRKGGPGGAGWGRSPDGPLRAEAELASPPIDVRDVAGRAAAGGRRRM